MSNHQYSWLVVLYTGEVHQMDADRLRFAEGFAIWEMGDREGDHYVTCAMPLSEVRVIDVMSQLSGYPTQRSVVKAGGGTPAKPRRKVPA